MLVSMNWLNKLTDEEYLKVLAVKTGETICPRGIIIDENRLEKSILEKIKK